MGWYWLFNICSNKSLQFHAYINMVLSSLKDTKSHSGVVIIVGEAVVYVPSWKQKLMINIPEEAELVGPMDNLGPVALFGK